MHLPAHPMVRAALSVAALSAWLVLLFTGWTAGGAVHLLFAASLALFPWRAAMAPGPEAGDEPPVPEEDSP